MSNDNTPQVNHLNYLAALDNLLGCVITEEDRQFFEDKNIIIVADEDDIDYYIECTLPTNEVYKIYADGDLPDVTIRRARILCQHVFEMNSH